MRPASPSLRASMRAVCPGFKLKEKASMFVAMRWLDSVLGEDDVAAVDGPAQGDLGGAGAQFVADGAQGGVGGWRVRGARGDHASKTMPRPWE